MIEITTYFRNDHNCRDYSNPNKNANKLLLKDIDEEKVHAGEFLRLVKKLAPDKEKIYMEGA